FLKAPALFGVVHDGGPGLDGILVCTARALPEIDQCAAHVRILHAQWRIEVPGVGDAALAAARLIRREAVLERGIIESLHLPGDDPVLDVDLPRAGAGAIHAVGRADDLVV